jgi:hypothetical protein
VAIAYVQLQSVLLRWKWVACNSALCDCRGKSQIFFCACEQNFISEFCRMVTAQSCFIRTIDLTVLLCHASQCMSKFCDTEF